MTGKAEYDPQYIEYYNRVIRDNATGIYIPHWGFCVMTKDRNSTQIEKTFNHELLHVLIDEHNKSHWVNR